MDMSTLLGKYAKSKQKDTRLFKPPLPVTVNKTFLLNTVNSVESHNRREEVEECWRTNKLAKELNKRKREPSEESTKEHDDKKYKNENLRDVWAMRKLAAVANKTHPYDNFVRQASDSSSGSSSSDSESSSSSESSSEELEEGEERELEKISSKLKKSKHKHKGKKHKHEKKSNKKSKKSKKKKKKESKEKKRD